MSVIEKWLTTQSRTKFDKVATPLTASRALIAKSRAPIAKSRALIAQSRAPIANPTHTNTIHLRSHPPPYMIKLLIDLKTSTKR